MLTVHGRQYGVAKIGGCIFWDDPEEIKLSGLKLRIKQRFVYEYDFYDQWHHEIRLGNKLPLSAKKAYPICITGSGRTPPEDCGGALAYLKQLEEHSLVSIYMRMNDIWDEVARTILSEDGDIRCQDLSPHQSETGHSSLQPVPIIRKRGSFSYLKANRDYLVN